MKYLSAVPYHQVVALYSWTTHFALIAHYIISKMYFSHRKPPDVSERMWSLDFDASSAGEYQTLGRYWGWTSE
jgi:hypothetical protein